MKKVSNGFVFNLKRFLKNPGHVGTISPDSRFCADIMLKHIDFSKADVIVEWGTGSGAITDRIISRKKDSTIFISIDRCKESIRRAEIKFDGTKNTFFVSADLSETSDILRKLGLSHTDYVISTIPISNQPEIVKFASEIVRGCFVQYMHFISLFKFFWPMKTMKDRFPDVSWSFVLLNLPPAFVFYCWKNGKRGHL